MAPFDFARDASTLLLGLALSAVLIAAVHLVRVYSRLSHIPGPFLAGLSNLTRVSWVLTGRSHRIHIALHQKYGDFVRFGPNMVSIGNPAYIPEVYPLRPGLKKSAFYSVLSPYVRGQKAHPALFSARDEATVKLLKNPIAPIYSKTSTLLFEKYADSTIECLLKQIDRRFAGTGDVCDLGQWLNYFALDFMGEITFSKRYGFLDAGHDVDGVMGYIWNHMKSAAPITQIPWLDKFWNKNPVLAYFRPPTASPMISFGMKKVQERRAAAETYGEATVLNPRDFLSRFLEAQARDPTVPPWAVIVWVFSNVTAGSDSTAAVLRTTLFNLLTHPATLAALRAELAAAAATGALSTPCRWREVADLPYLDACLREGARLHAPFGLPFERDVPPGGVTIGGHHFPEGTVLGISPFVANYHKPTYGADADDWRPERWLCDGEQRRDMEEALMTYGAGRRACLGKHVAYLEMKKLVPTLVTAYDFEVVRPEGFRVENFWFVRQLGFKVKITKRSA